MRAIHINHTAPFMKRNGQSTYLCEDFELLTCALSALKWREHNGTIKMVTDSTGYKFYADNNLLSLWDDVSCALDNIPNWNFKMFWAGAKLYALSLEDAPVAVMDTDFIVWAPLAFSNLGDVTAIHRESIYTDVYPDINTFKMKRGYIFDPDWDWREEPVNTAFYVIKNRELKDKYTKEAFLFMENAIECGDCLTYMVFAEQRILPMCAKAMDCRVDSFSKLERLFNDGERYFTHTWGMKQQMRDMPKLRYDFCMRCANRIKRDFPDYAKILGEVDILKKYF